MDDAKLVAASAIALAVTLFTIFWMRALARRFGLVDCPDERKHHRGRVPLVGGLCIFLGTIAGLVYLGYIDRLVASLLVPSTLIVMTGMVDDFFALSVRSRLIIQGCAAFVVIAATGVYFDHAGQLFGDHDLYLGVLGIPITIVAVIGLINAFNMLDGIDGLAASQAMVSIAAIALFVGGGLPTLDVMLLLQVLFAALIPYLCVNLGWPDGRKIFMGDAGSMLIGFLLAWSLVFLSHRGIAQLAPVDTLWCVALPIMETLAVMYRRVRIGRSPFKPDRQHLHHLLLDAGCSPRAALLLIVAASGLLALTGYALRNAPELLSLTVFSMLLAMYVLQFESVLAWTRAALGWEQADGMPAAPSTRMHSATPMRMRPPAAPRAHAEFAAIDGAPPAALKTLCVMGTPPDAVQIAPIARLLSSDARFDAKVCVAAPAEQAAAENPDAVLRLFGIEPDIHVGTASTNADHAQATSATLEGMKRVMSEFQPHVVLVPGDTPATLATTMAAFYQQIPVVCVEPDVAGHPSLRRLDGADRKLASTFASLHLSPSESASHSLLSDGISVDRILVTGNTAVDSLRTAVARIQSEPLLAAELARDYSFLRTGSPLLLVANCERMAYGFEPVCRALRKIAMRRPDVDIVYPADLAHDAMGRVGDLLRACPNIHLVAPTDYAAFAYLLSQAHLVLAASSEIAAEAAALGKPLLLMHGDGEPAPIVGHANVKAIGMHEREIADEVIQLLDDRRLYDAMCRSPGDSDCDHASRRIVEALAGMRPGASLPAAARTSAPVAALRPAIKNIQEAS